MHEFGNYGRTVSCIKKNLIMRQYISFCHTCCWLAVQGAKLTKLTEPIAQVKILRGKMMCPRSDWAVLWFGFGGTQFQICLCPVLKSQCPEFDGIQIFVCISKLPCWLSRYAFYETIIPVLWVDMFAARISIMKMLTRRMYGTGEILSRSKTTCCKRSE